MNNEPIAATSLPEPAPNSTPSTQSAPAFAPSVTPSTQLARPAVATVSAMKPNSASAGWRTTEFWMTALSHVGLLLAASAGALPPQYAAIAIAASQVAYNLSRGMAKQNPAPTSLLAAH